MLQLASFDVDASDAESVADALLGHGAVSVELSDAEAGTAAEQSLYGEPGADQGAAWPHQRVRALFPEGADVRAAVAGARAGLGLAWPIDMNLGPLADQDWVQASREQFTPIQVSSRLWIVPSWCHPPDAAAINLTLDPGLAFGTGSHPTTRQCLSWLDAKLPPGASVLDYGCGSGVLALAAKRLGAGAVVAVDIDRAALDVTRANAAANGIEITLAALDAVPVGPYDVVVANILANPLRVLAPLLADLVRPGGWIVLAGILTAQAQTVAAAYAPWLTLSPSSEEGGWVCLTGMKRID